MIRIFGNSRKFAVVAGAAAVVAVAMGIVAPAALSASRASAGSRTAAIPECTAGDLGVWVALDQAGVAAGTAYYPLEFTNLSKHACTMFGFPGVAVLAANGKELGDPAARDHTVAAHTVRLTAGATAHALLEYSDVVTGNCPKSGKRTAFDLQIFPPNQTRTDHAFWDLAACAAKGSLNFLRVRVVQAGVGLRQ